MKKDSESNSSDKSNKEELSTGRRGGNPMIIALVITVLAAMLFFNQPEPSSLISASSATSKFRERSRLVHKCRPASLQMVMRSRRSC